MIGIWIVKNQNTSKAMTIKSILTEKSLGILMHPSSFPGGTESGTFGIEAKEWIKKLSNYGINYWQKIYGSIRE